MKFVSAQSYASDRLAEVINGCFEGQFDLSGRILEDRLRRWDLKAEHSLVADDGEIRALGMLGVRQERGWLAYIGVLPEARGQGLAYRLCDRLIQRARELGVAQVALETMQTNAPAIATYHKLGFQEWRSLEIWECPGVGREIPADGHWGQVRDRFEKFLEADPPWQREAASLDDALPCLWNEEACLIYNREQGLVLSQILGRREAAVELLQRLGPGWKLNNLPAGSPWEPTLSQLGASVSRRQWDMLVRLR